MTTEVNDKPSLGRHLPTMLLGLIVAAIFLIAVFSFQVNETETAVVTVFGKIEEQTAGAGLHFRWPYPIQEIFKFDHRDRCFSGSTGKLEETLTRDGQNVIVSIFVVYRIADAKDFFRSLVTVVNAEDQLNNWMRSIKDETFGKYEFSQLVNREAGKMCLGQIEQEILLKLAAKTVPYGLQVKAVGINAINIPESISGKVFDRMINERKVAAERYRAEGRKEAEKIRIEADRKKQMILTDAQAEAKEIRAQGDADAAKFYAVFNKNPDLAAFLRKLDALQTIMKTKTTLILDTESAPFDLLKMNAEQLKVVPPAQNSNHK